VLCRGGPPPLDSRGCPVRWKQELTQVAPLFVAVEIVDATPPTEEYRS
jgi:hypothetical protein